MFKGFGLFEEKYGEEAINEYFKVLDKYKFKFGISKYSHHTDHINIMARMNFQYLQCLDLINPKYVEHYKKLWNHENDNYDILDENNDGKIISLAKYSTDFFSKIACGEKFHVLKFLGATDSEQFELNSNYIKAVCINDIMLNDPCIKKSVLRRCRKLIEEMKLGKIYARGFYHTVVGDIIGYLEYVSGMEPVGVLKEYEFLTHTIFEDNSDMVSFRSPLVCPSEVNKIKMRTGKEYDEYFGHFKNQDIVMINMYDLSMPVQGGMDADGDAVFLSDEPILVNNKINKTMIIDIDDKVTAKKVEYNQENITDYELKSRDSRIGEITNIATSILNKYSEDENLNKIYADDVSLLRLYQGKEIDSIKTGVRWNITKRLRNNLKKIPYFLLYNYEDKLKKYYTIKEKNKKLNSENKISVNAFNSPTQMNELCDYINRWQTNCILWNKSQVNTGVLLIDNSVDANNEYLLRSFKKINCQFVEEWKELLRQKDVDDSVNLNKCLNKYKNLILGFSDDRKMISNHFIKASYKSINTDKTLCWYTFGNDMIENLIKNSPNYSIDSFVESKEKTEYEYLGKYYSKE